MTIRITMKGELIMLETVQRGFILPIVEKDIRTDGKLDIVEFCNEFILGFNMNI